MLEVGEVLATFFYSFLNTKNQRWSRGHKARGQGHKKNPRPRPRTAFPRTDTLEAMDRNARGQGQGPRTQAQVLSKKKKVSTKIFQAISKKKSSQKFFKRSPRKNVFQKIFQPLHKILTIQKILLSSSRGQANFRIFEDLRPRGQGQGLQNVSSRTPPLLRMFVVQCFKLFLGILHCNFLLQFLSSIAPIVSAI